MNTLIIIIYWLNCSYLIDRQQFVIFNDQNSETSITKTGVPQGSILGPLFFSICINDLITVSDKLKFIMYADDTTIYFNLERKRTLTDII